MILASLQQELAEALVKARRCGRRLTAGFAELPSVERGYAVVTEDVRGRYESEGAFLPLTQETNDGDDTINWIARLIFQTYHSVLRPKLGRIVDILA